MSLKNRSEILFLYDVNYTNPNGDPVDMNKPRIDEETGINIVTDVRLKRTIRDYLYESKGEEIFVREISNEHDQIQDAKMRAEDFLTKDGQKVNKANMDIAEMKKIIHENVLKECIDTRLFGVTLPIEKDSKNKSSITLTGPVQFKMGRSLHRVKLEYIKGTGAFASGKERAQKTFREEYVLPYSLIAFYGIINENASVFSKMTEDDANKLIEAIWMGTKNLISRSKFGQQPRMLIRVAYKEKNFHIGELDKLITLKSEKNDEEIRDVSEYQLIVTNLIERLRENVSKIEKVYWKIDPRLQLSEEDFQGKLEKYGITVEKIEFNLG